MEELVKVTPDRERAKSLLKMANLRLDNIGLVEREDARKYTSKIIEDYYEMIIEIVTAIMSLDGYKTRSDAVGSHIASINYMRRYKEIGGHEIALMEDLRKKRIGVKYYGREVGFDYLARKEKSIKDLINKIKSIAEGKLGV